jgi:hypothetical protein
MSWFERIEVQLRPASVAIRRAPLWSAAGGAVKAVPVPTRAGESTETWREPLQTLARVLDEAQARGAALHVVLSDQFCRFALIPWSADLVRESERIAFARLSFSQTYGQASEGWDIALDESLTAQPAIAAALDRAFLHALREVCAARRVRLVSMVPAFVRDVERHRSALRGEDFWLARVETGRLTLALRQRGAWSAIRSRRLDGTGAEALANALRQEALACGVAPKGSVYLIDASGSVQAIPGWQTTRLGSSTPAPAAVSAPARRPAPVK